MVRRSAAGRRAVGLVLGLGLLGRGGEAFAAVRDRCGTVTPSASRPNSTARPAVVFFTAEVRRPVAAGSKLVVLSGDVPAPGAEALAQLVEEAYRYVVGDLGFGGFPDRIALRFGDLPVGMSGSATWTARAASAEILLSRELSAGELRRALAHQLGHLATAAAAREDLTGWGEATAAWLGARIVADSEGIARAVTARLQQPGTAPWADPGDGAAAWPTFLAARFGDDVVRRIWEHAVMEPTTGTLRAIEMVLAAHGSSVPEELEAFAAWLVAESRRRDPHDGSLDWAVDAHAYPAHGDLRRGPDPGPFGFSLLRFATSDVAGGLRLELGADPAAAWRAVAILVPIGSSVPKARLALRRSSDGRARLAIPAAAFEEVIVAVFRLGPDAPLDLQFSAEADETFPFELAAVEAAADAGRVRVSWSTTSESDVESWAVLRSVSPAAPFVPILGAPVPGAWTAGSLSGAEYVVSDESVEPGRTYYYRVEAQTSDGLSAPSHLVSVSVPRSAGSRY